LIEWPADEKKKEGVIQGKRGLRKIGLKNFRARRKGVSLRGKA